MITTIFLLLLASFEIWYITSKQFKQANPPGYMVKIISNGKKFIIVAAVLLLICIALFILKLGWTSGVTAAIVSLMAAASLIVTIQPFRYVRIPMVVALYLSFLLFEIFIF